MSAPVPPSRFSGLSARTSLILTGILFLAFLIAPIFSSPAGVRNNNAPGQFDTQRALTRMINILDDQSPHPVDSDANRRVRDAIIREIETLGFIAETRTDTGCFARDNVAYIACAEVENISFRMGPTPQTGAKNTLMISTHYDSVPAGPGASDAMMGVGVILEIAQQLSGKPLSRPVLVLITDGEEAGLLGARAFMRSDPRATEVSTVVNFEARGVEGPVFMFETSQPNGLVIPYLMKGSKRPVANSVMAAIYEQLPNSTDVSVYLPQDMEALNFAIIGNERFYHTPGDNLDNLSKRSLQHMGDMGLNTVRNLTDPDAKIKTNAQRLIYTDFLSRGMIALPQWVALPVMIIGLAVGIGIFFWPTQEADGMSLLHRLRPLLVPPILLLITGLLGTGFSLAISMIRPEAVPWAANSWSFYVCALLTALVPIALFAGPLAGRTTIRRFFAACWIWYAIAGIGMCFVLPGGTIIFVLPILVLTLSVLSGFAFLPGAVIGAFLAAISTLIVWSPVVGLIGEALGYANLAMIGVIATITALPWLSFLVRVDTGHAPFAFSLRSELWRYGTLSGALLVSLLITLMVPAYSANHPRHLNVRTIADPENGTAKIAMGSRNLPLPKAMRSVAETQYGGIDAPAPTIPEWRDNQWTVSAPIPTLRPPMLRRLPGADARQAPLAFQAQLEAPDSDRVTIMIPQTLGLNGFSIGTEQFDVQLPERDDGTITFRCIGQRCRNVDLGFGFTSKTPATLLLYGETFATTEHAHPMAAARPNWAIARQTGDRSIMVQRVRTDQLTLTSTPDTNAP